MNLRNIADKLIETSQCSKNKSTNNYLLMFHTLQHILKIVKYIWLIYILMIYTSLNSDFLTLNIFIATKIPLSIINI